VRHGSLDTVGHPRECHPGCHLECHLPSQGCSARVSRWRQTTKGHPCSLRPTTAHVFLLLNAGTNQATHNSPCSTFPTVQEDCGGAEAATLSTRRSAVRTGAHTITAAALTTPTWTSSTPGAAKRGGASYLVPRFITASPSQKLIL
jgi:hypothetical protein